MYARTRALLSRRTLLLAGAVSCPIVLAGTAIADAHAAHIPEYHWSWESTWYGFDHASLRRGYQVYKEVCASCHSLNMVHYRQMVGEIFTEAQAKLEASQQMVEDGPDDEGEMFLRPGRLTDKVPPPYKNDMAARAANNGSLPPDLTLITDGRPGGPNYVFSLLTGYPPEGEEPPTGITLGRAQYLNPFMEGGIIGMPPPLNDGAVEYPDGTPATASQMAKDVCTFLFWCGREGRHMEERKRFAMSMFGGGVLFWFVSGNVKRYMFNHFKTLIMEYKVGPHP